MSTFLDPTKLRLAVFANGYMPLPITDVDFPNVKSPGKQPYFTGWTKLGRHNVTPDVIRGWERDVAKHSNTGILTGDLVGVDIDITVPELAKQIDRLAEELLGSTPLHRVGKQPKLLRCYRVERPFRKIETPELLLPDDEKLQVEILADGQQFVGFGIHPGTLKPYEWLSGSPETIPCTELPTVSESRLQAFLDASEMIIRRAGGLTKTEHAERKPKIAPAQEPAPKPRSSSPGKDPTFFARANKAALENLARWVPSIFPKARQEAGTGAWRIKSADLGRQLEEDLSLHPTSGGRDFGTGKSCSPIDVVVQFSTHDTPVAAALWLCDAIGTNPVDLGYEPPRKTVFGTPVEDPDDWPVPIDFLSDHAVTGVPVLRPDHVPGALWPFVQDTSKRLGVDPTSVALAALATCASVLTDDWALQPKALDTQWTEAPRIWVAILGDPSILKTPVIAACTKPVDTLEAAARKQHSDDMRAHKIAHKAWKDSDGNPGTEPRPPKRARRLIEETTMEALSEALRDDDEGRQFAPARKVMVRQDEMSEWIAGFDKYRSGGGGSDRGAWLRAYNGARVSLRRGPSGCEPPATLSSSLRRPLRCVDGWRGGDHHRPGAASALEPAG